MSREYGEPRTCPRCGHEYRTNIPGYEGCPMVEPCPHAAARGVAVGASDWYAVDGTTRFWRAQKPGFET